MESLRLSVEGNLVAPSSERSPTLPAHYYTAGMLQCTTEADPWPERVDYLLVERIARDIRNQYIAALFGRAKRMLCQRLARGVRTFNRTYPRMRLPRWGSGNSIGRVFQRLADYVSRLEGEQREAYLAGATDIYDLERRMRELESPTRLPSRMPLR